MERNLHITAFGTCTAFTLILLCLLILSGCSTPRPEKVDVERALNHREDIDKLKRFENYKYVTIEASDIELPPHEALGSPPDERIYTFSVWIDNPFNGTDTTKASDKDINALILAKDLLVDVVGAKATITPVSYGTSIDSRAQVQIQVESKDIAQSFSIIAWFPQEYKKFEVKRQENIKKLQDTEDGYKQQLSRSQNPLQSVFGASDKAIIAETDRKLTYERDRLNPYGEKKLVRVFNGDLRTQIILVSEDEVKNQFGKEFVKFFHVGRIYLRNQHVDKKLIVYTTSIRAKTMLYRAPNDEVASALAKNQAKNRIHNFLERMVSPPILASQKSLSDEEIKDLVSGAVKVGDLENSAIEAKLREDMAVKTVWDDKDKENQARKVIAFTSARVKDDDKPRIAVIQNEACGRFGTDPNGGTIQRSSYQIKVNPSPRNLALSANGSKQAEFDAQGLIWEDYYRPMTFQTVLTSLMTVTDLSWQNQLVNYLTTTGEVAAGLVGLTSIAGKFGNKTYSDAVAFGVGVILPEARKLLLDDLSQHISNLQAASLDTIREVPPNGVVDGYIYFPKGPIFGYGVDEFSITEPSFIVNIDNTDVQVEAALVEMSYKLESGIKSAAELTTDALNKGISNGTPEKEALDSLYSRAKASRLRMLQKDIDELVSKKEMVKAKRLLAGYIAVYGKEGTEGLDSELNSKPKSGAELESEVALKDALSTYYIGTSTPTTLTSTDTINIEKIIATHKASYGGDGIQELVSKFEEYLSSLLRKEIASSDIAMGYNKFRQFETKYPHVKTDDLKKTLDNFVDKDFSALQTLVTGQKTRLADEFMDKHPYVWQHPKINELCLNIRKIRDEAFTSLENTVNEYLGQKKTKLADNAVMAFKKLHGTSKDTATETLHAKITTVNKEALDVLEKQVMECLKNSPIVGAYDAVTEFEKLHGPDGDIKGKIDELRTTIKAALDKESQKKEAIPKDSATEKGKNAPASSETGNGGGG